MQRDDVIRGVISVLVNSSSPEMIASATSNYMTEDVSDRLPHITNPVLVLQLGSGAEWLRAPLERLAQALPNGTLLSIESTAVIPIIGNVDGLIGSIHNFLDAP